MREQEKKREGKSQHNGKTATKKFFFISKLFENTYGDEVKLHDIFPQSFRCTEHCNKVSKKGLKYGKTAIRCKKRHANVKLHTVANHLITARRQFVVF